MNPAYHQQLTDNFLRASELDPGERRAFLARLRAEDPRMGAEVASLLGHDEHVPPILDHGLATREELLPHPDRVGPYRLQERIGTGGMGIVYRAEQSEPFEREVAIKLIRAGFETRRVLARFDAERRVLARMDHPNIARVLDAGTTATGRPFVAMEYVRGEPITRFCDRVRLDVHARLRLFLDVCDAVHYAHQNAIIHRDLKPSNVLVTSVDTRAVPKIIDFGIAKALGSDGAYDPTPTEAGQLIGTPAYMSPEQASLGESNPDIRSDVYSLGALLYELLVGCTPLDLPTGDERGTEEIRRIIREQEPRRPSAKVATSGAAASETAAKRGTDPAALVRRLRGDLDSIVSMALAKERKLRYGSASELAADVRRYLEHEPIQARPPAALYRLQKLARRNRTATAVVATLVPVLFTSAVVLALQARQLATQRDRAEEVSELLVRSYEVPFAITRRAGPRSAMDVLRHNRARIEQELVHHPVLQARMLTSIGESLRGVGEPLEALPILERSYDRLRRELGEEDRSTLAARHSLARTFADRGQTSEAEAALVVILEVRTRKLGADDLETLRTMSDLALLYRDTGRDAEAARLLEGVVARLPSMLGESHTETLVNASLLAAVYLDQRRLDEAEALILRYLPHMPAELGERAKALYNLACIHALRGERDAAFARLRESQSGFTIGYYADPNLRSLFDDPRLLDTARAGQAQSRWEELSSLASHWVWAGRLAQAEALYRHLRSVLAARDESLAFETEWELATVLELRGRYGEALPLIERRIERRGRTYGPREPLFLERWYLAQAHLGAGDVASARDAIKQTIRTLEGNRSLSSRPWLLYCRARLAGIEGDRAAAVRQLHAAVEAGFTNYELMQRDLAFRSLRGTLEFRKARETMERRYALPLPKAVTAAS
jgi:non-specific serine/threonine protein kinase/serine/threonine-protein kinase